jgi:hypothetical protein
MDNLQEIEQDKNSIKYWFEDFFENGFSKIYEKWEKKLPYHINLIDLLHANENAHSRILGKLLQQKSSSGEFEILTSFIQYLTKKNKGKTFNNIKIIRPEITVEIERVDIWIRDFTTKYALIIENKVHWAGDQEEQLCRYVDKTINHGFKKENIYVLYLPPTDNKDPDERTWGPYKDEFQDRYLKITFRDEILPWLKHEVLPKIKNKDTFLRSALEQYIDHLEGMFNLRLIEKDMN